METLDDMDARHKREKSELISKMIRLGAGPKNYEIAAGEMKLQTRFVARKYCMPVSELIGPRKHRVYNEPRREIWCSLKGKGYSLKQIGAFFNRHHTSILHGIQQHEARNGRMG